VPWSGLYSDHGFCGGDHSGLCDFGPICRDHSFVKQPRLRSNDLGFPQSIETCFSTSSALLWSVSVFSFRQSITGSISHAERAFAVDAERGKPALAQVEKLEDHGRSVLPADTVHLYDEAFPTVGTAPSGRYDDIPGLWNATNCH
jgi:hypothetical protein